MLTFGVPEVYIKMHKCEHIPMIIPISGLTNMPQKNVKVYGTISAFFDLQIGKSISTSIVKIIAQIIIADKAEVGMYAKCGVKKAHAETSKLNMNQRG